MASPHKRTAARGVGGGSGNDIEAAKLDAPRAKFRKGAQLDLEDAIAAAPPRVRQKERRSGQALAVIATINKSHCSQLRVSISQWRDLTKVELREVTATTPRHLHADDHGITLEIFRIDELIAALEKAKGAIG